MTTEERKEFWNGLIAEYKNDRTEDLLSSPICPERLCRFRCVNENTIYQLETNRLYFSSADYYDDPFDTYCNIDCLSFRKAFQYSDELIDSDDFFQFIFDMIPSTLITRQQLKNELEKLDDQPFRASEIEKKILTIKQEVKKRVYSICFGDDMYNEPLWMKYADSYRGFALVYDMDDHEVFRDMDESDCSGWTRQDVIDTLFPICYTNDKYDATRLVFSLILIDVFRKDGSERSMRIAEELESSLRWEMELISLVKKQCHEYDQEWRMIYPKRIGRQPFISMKPSRVIIGLRMPDWDRQAVLDACFRAGVDETYQLYIDAFDRLDMQKI